MTCVVQFYTNAYDCIYTICTHFRVSTGFGDNDKYDSNLMRKNITVAQLKQKWTMRSRWRNARIRFANDTTGFEAVLND